MRYVLSLLFLIQTIALGAMGPAQVDWSIKRAFIPVGFDDSNNAQVVIVGIFPNSCYQLGPVNIEKNGNTIVIRQVAFVSGLLCLQVLNPFSKVVDLGRLSKADYTVVDGPSGTRLGTLPVVAAPEKAGPDDYPYAPVQDATVETNTDGSRTLRLTGFFTDSCMGLTRPPMTHYYPDVVVVQPIVDMKPRSDCASRRTPFQQFYPLKNEAPKNFLLHVRSMNGQAINKIIGDPY